MFKSLFAKYITIFITIIILGFLILTSVMGYFIGRMAMTVKYDLLYYVASSVAYYVSNDRIAQEAYIDFNLGYDIEFTEFTDILSKNMDELTIFVTDEKGNIVAYNNSDNKPKSDFFEQRENDISISEDVFSELESGKVIKRVGNLDGSFAEYRVSVAVPVFFGEKYIGSVFASTNDTSAVPMVKTMMMTLTMASLCIMLACLFSVYIISIRLTKPLRDMSMAAKEIAVGNFDRTIPVNGEDEVAQLAVAFNDMAKALRDLDYMRSSFVSNVSHELRTPMTTIGGFIDSIIDGVIPPEQEKHYLELISNEVKRLSRLITSLLEISRIESGQKKLAFSTFDICEMARIILISNEQRLEAKKLDVSFECDNDRIDVIADKDAIHQIFFNICDNAIKFSDEGGKYVIAIKDKGERVQISVYNEGIGIEEHDIPFVFDRFFKTDRSRGLDRSGVGLGLFIVKSIIVAHGENIKVESEYGKWCRFVFTLKKAGRKGKQQ